MIKDATILTSGAVAGGIPEDVQSGIIQVVVMLVTWALTKLFDRKKK